ncbi:hypothetical protein PIB30_084515 [Stylosanthes scabra]|uniref:Uncharacterized protein n=1 Tax=Stylosanthes scabra TaxID=79078 RepID=A0ABU6ZR60_9FABA|nr:hypothetical protein [Stylosanthes scabra]
MTKRWNQVCGEWPKIEAIPRWRYGPSPICSTLTSAEKCQANDTKRALESPTPRRQTQRLGVTMTAPHPNA